MLKWLVTKNPPPAQTLSSSLLTEDPLATISRRHHKNEPIYSVSRVNPIFEEESPSLTDASLKTTKAAQGKGEECDLPESPPTDHGSVRSSGYGSKEADSVSYLSDPQDEGISETGEACFRDLANSEIIHRSLGNAAGNVAELRRSFENLSKRQKPTSYSVDIIQQNPKYVKSIDIPTRRTFSLESIPEDLNEPQKEPTYFQRSYWPRVSHLAEELQRKTDEILERNEDEKQIPPTNHERNCIRTQNLRFNPLVSVVAQDGRYVTAISVSPGRKSSQSNKNVIRSDDIKIEIEPSKEIPHYFKENSLATNSEFPLLSLQPDSLINEDTLRMMNYPGYDCKPTRQENSLHGTFPIGEMPMFGKALYSGLDSTLRGKSSIPQQRPRSHPATAQRVSSSSKHCAKKKGVIAVKDLWEKSGLKTNGRKLLVDIGEIPNQVEKPTKYEPSKLPTFYNSLPSLITDSHQYEAISTSSSGQSLYYYSIPALESYGNLQKFNVGLAGIDNPTFVDDTGSNTCKSVPNFQHNLTNFQKRLTERHKDFQREPIPSTSKNKLIDSKSRTFSLKKINGKSSSVPGKAVLEFGLTEERWKKSKAKRENANQPYSTRKEKDSQESRNYGQLNREQAWKNIYSNPRESKKSNDYYIRPHPNNGAPLFEPGGHSCQDFTLDAYALHRLKESTSKKEKRQRCCSIVLVLMAFCSFIAVIIGVSWFYTGGEKIFGSM